MSGILTFLLGAIISAIGFGVTYASSQAGDVVVVAYGAMISGPLLMISGAYTFCRAFWFRVSLTEEERQQVLWEQEQQRVDLERHTIARCAIAVSIAEKQLTPLKVHVVGMITQFLYGRPIDGESFQQVCNEMSSWTYDLNNELEKTSEIISDNGQCEALIGAMAVAICDGAIGKKEQKVLNRIRKKFSMSKKLYNECLAEAEQRVSNMRLENLNLNMAPQY